jgi:hypothetical protein
MKVLPIPDPRIPGKQPYISLTLAVFIAVFSISSCKKDKLPDQVSIRDSLIVVNFVNNSIPLNLIDSAHVFLQKKGSGTTYFLRFDKQKDNLTANIDGLRAGEYTMSAYLYSRVVNSNEKREYFFSDTLEIGNNGGQLVYGAPDGTLFDAWKIRAIFSYDNGLDFYIPWNNEEAYFRVRAADKNRWKKLEIRREAYNRIAGMGSELIASGNWKCESACFTAENIIVNESAFSPFAENVKNKTWNRTEIEIIAIDIADKKIEDLFIFNK